MPCYTRLLMIIAFLSSSIAVLVVGPKFVRSNHDYTVVISNYFEQSTKISLRLLMEGYSFAGSTTFSIAKNVSVWNYKNRVVRFNVPYSSLTHDVKLTIEGQEGFSYYSEEHLVYLSTATAGLIQINKPVFKPGETMRFRVIVLDTEMKPPAGLESINVTIRDPQANSVQHWPSAKLYAGVFESDLQMTMSPSCGKWNIMVYLNEEELVSKSFEVLEYVLPSFDLQVLPTVLALDGCHTLNLNIAAKHHFGIPAQGMVAVWMYNEEGKHHLVKILHANGRGQVSLQLREQSDEEQDQTDVRVKVSFFDKYTDQCVSKDVVISINQHPYQATLSPKCEEYCPEAPFNCSIFLNHPDGSPASNVALWVDVSGKGIDNNETYTTDHDGKVTVLIRPVDSTEGILVIVTYHSKVLLWEKIYKKETMSKSFIKLQLISDVKLHQRITIIATCNEEISFLVYYVIHKQNVVDEGFIRTFGMIKHKIEINATKNMLPKATIFVATVLNKTMIWDSLQIDFEQMKNRLFITLNETEVKSGHQMEVRLKGRAGAYIGLAAYDESLLGFSKQHILFWKDVFESFHGPGENEYDAFYSKRIFVKLSGGVQVGNTLIITDRSDRGIVERASNHEPLRANFMESWLWKNVTLGSSGSLTLVELVPDRTASWCLVGFSIDPMDGFGIIKKPIQFKTFKSLYIVDHLPKFIKRGEKVELRFTLLNNLEHEHTFNVTLYNVANQIEFIGWSPEDQSCTQSKRVGPKSGVSVSFLVKVRKLGEVDILVRAYTLSVIETVSFEKVVRVVPESLLFRKTESRNICFDTYTNQTFIMRLLEINKKADAGSPIVQVSLHPNLLIGIKSDLNDLLELLSRRGDENFITQSHIITVRDYLNAIGSTDLKLVEKAHNLMRQSYQNQMRFHQRNGSFRALKNTGIVFLTALTANALQTASKYITELDTAVIQKAFDWLATQQHSSGRFDEVGSDTRKQRQAGLRNGVVLTSYVLIAFLENDNAKVKHAEVIEKGMRYVTKQFSNITDAYDMSIATYAIVLNDQHMKYDALKKLNDLSTDTPSHLERYWNTPNSLETTAYALLSFLKGEKYQDSIPIMRWLAKQQYDTECIIRTQNICFIGLRALTKLAEKMSPFRNDYVVNLMYKNYIKSQFTSDDPYLTRSVEVSHNSKTIDINVSGLGFGLLQVVSQYRLDLRNFDNRFKLTLEKQNMDIELRLKVCASFIPLWSDRSNLTMVEVNLPSGYVVDHNPISEQTLVNPTKDIEFRFGNTSLVVYYNYLSTNSSCFTVTAYRRLKVALRRPAYVIVYDFYEPFLNAIQMYEVDDLQPCEISDENNCVAEKKCANDKN